MCKVCIVVKNLHSGDAPAVSILPAIEWHSLLIAVYRHDAVTPLLHKGFDAHAPPYFS